MFPLSLLRSGVSHSRGNLLVLHACHEGIRMRTIRGAVLPGIARREGFSVLHTAALEPQQATPTSPRKHRIGKANTASDSSASGISPTTSPSSSSSSSVSLLLKSSRAPVFQPPPSWPSMTSIGVSAHLHGKLQARLGVYRATPIQAAASPLLLGAIEGCPGSASRYDVVLRSETGSGKTLAYLLPLITALFPQGPGLATARTRLVIAVPTRELSHQVAGVLTSLAEGGTKRVVALRQQQAADAIAHAGSQYSKDRLRGGFLAAAGGGGASPSSSSSSSASTTMAGAAIAHLSAPLRGLPLLRVARIAGEASIQLLAELQSSTPPHILVGTPTSLARLIPEHVNCGELSALVLDEADELARAHHSTSMRSLIGATSKKMKLRPALIAVSATSTPTLDAFLDAHWRKGYKTADLLPSRGGSSSDSSGSSSPVSSSSALKRTGESLSVPSTIKHYAIHISKHPQAAYPAVTRFLATIKPRAVIAFVNSASRMEALEVYLRSKGVRVAVLGSSYGNRERAASLSAISRGRVQVLIATEMGARGLDLPILTHVLNVDLPLSSNEYVHRAGRVGRIGSSTGGAVVSLVASGKQRNPLDDGSRESATAQEGMVSESISTSASKASSATGTGGSDVDVISLSDNSSGDAVAATMMAENSSASSLSSSFYELSSSAFPSAPASNEANDFLQLARRCNISVDDLSFVNGQAVYHSAIRAATTHHA